MEGAGAEAAEAYREARDADRKRLEESRKDDPLLTGVGQVAGSLLVPIGAAGQAATLPAAALRGAAIGGATGAVTGAGEAKSLEDIPADVAKMGAFGALTGAAAPVAMQGLKAAKGAAAEAIARPLAKAGEQADELRVLTTMGATGGTINAPKVLREVERVPGGVAEAARVLRESGISKGLTTTSGVLRRATAAREASGASIGKMLDDASNAALVQGPGLDRRAVDTAKLAASLRAQADEIMSGMGGVSDVTRQQANNLTKLAERIEVAAPTGRATFEDVKALSVGLGSDAGEAYLARASGRPVSGRSDALMSARRGAEGAIDEGMESVGKSSQAYRDARRLNQVSRIAEDAAEANLGRASKNNLLDLTSAALAAGGPAGMVAAGGRKVLGPLSASARATGAEAARSGAGVLRRIGAESAPSAASARAAGAFGGATMGAMDEPLTAAAPAPSLEALPPEDARLVRDLLQRGVSPDEVASILGNPDLLAMLGQ
jgi:hypothetical protein